MRSGGSVKQVAAILTMTGCLLLVYKSSQYYDLPVQQDLDSSIVRMEVSSTDSVSGSTTDLTASNNIGRYYHQFRLRGMLFDGSTKMGNLSDEWSTPFAVSVVSSSIYISMRA